MDLKIVHSPHPILAAADREITIVDCDTISPLSFYLRGIKDIDHHVVSLNDKVIDAGLWNVIVPRHGDLIAVRAIAKGGDSSNPAQIVATLALVALAVATGGVAAPALSASLGVTSAAGVAAVGAAITGAVMIAGTMVLGTIFPPPNPDLSFGQGRGGAGSPTYSLSGGSNRARLFAPLPLVVGQHRISPDMGAKTFVEFQSDAQFLYQVFNFGWSDLTLSDYRIGNTPLGDYNEVQTEESDGTGALTIFPGNVDSVAGVFLDYDDGWTTKTGSLTTTKIAIDITGTLYRIGDQEVETRTVDISMEYRLVGAGSWSTFLDAGNTVTLSNDSTKPLRLTYIKDGLASGQYEVRVKRGTLDETDPRNISMITFSQMRSYQPDEGDYTGQKRVAMVIRATGQINGQVQQFSALASSSIPVWNGSTWADGPTSNPAWIFLWIARGKVINSIRVFGGGIPDSKIDIEALKEWGTWCNTENFTCNLVFDRSMSVNEMLSIVARCGEASISWASGKLSVIWMAGGQPSVQMFGMNNIVFESFRVDYTTGKVADEIVCQFINPDLDWQTDTVRAIVPGVTNPVNPVNIELMGVTNKELAGRIASFMAASQKYHRKKISWETDIEGLVCTRGDVVTLSHDLTSWGASGRLISGTASVLVLSREVYIASGETYYISVRHPDGTTETRTVATAGPVSTDTITLGQDLSFSPDADTNNLPMDYTWVFDPKATPGRLVKIIEIAPLNQYQVRITAIEEVSAYYLADNYTYTTPITFGGALPVLTNLTITETLLRTGDGWQTQIDLVWDADGVYSFGKVRVGVNGGAYEEKGTTFNRRFSFLASDSGTLNIEVTGYDYLGRWGTVSRISTIGYVILGQSTPPPDPDTFLVSVTGEGERRFDWTMPYLPVDIAGYRIRYARGSTTTWADMTQLHDGLLLTSPHTTNQLAAGSYTLAIISEDTSGNVSNPVFISSVLGSPAIGKDIIKQNHKTMGWPGTKTDCFVSGEVLIAGGPAWNSLTASWDSYTTSWDEIPPLTSPIVYETNTITLPSDFTFTPLVSVDVTGIATVTMQTGTASDGATTGAFVPLANVTAKYLKIRISVAGSTPKIKACEVLLDGAIIVEEYPDVNTLNATDTWYSRIDVGHFRVGMREDCAGIFSAVISAIQSVSGGAFWELVNKTSTVGGFKAAEFKVYDKSGVATEATVDVYLKGIR